jgi:imidazoleglycerol-phosphate dehydratase/histidinol-phosphatase
MSERIAFLDRDGTLIEEPPGEQLSALEQVRFMPGVFAALSELMRHDYRLVMVTNQDGLGSASFPRAGFDTTQRFVLDAFSSQGIIFDAVLVCPHFASDNCQCRKPKPGLVTPYLLERDVDRESSVVIGDRNSDLELASTLKIRGLRVRRHGLPEETWPAAVEALLARRAEMSRQTRETAVHVRVSLDTPEPIEARTDIGFFDHMLEQLARHGGFSLHLKCRGDLRVDEHHTVEDCALTLGRALRKALGTKHGIARYGFLLPMDESEATVAIDLSGRPFGRFAGHFSRESVGGLPTELVPHFFRSLAEGVGAAIHIEVRGENAHHMIEACFKGVGRCLRQAFQREGSALPSTKGVL